MIIFGTRGVKSTMSAGNFNCPQCDQRTPYRHRKVTNFFTLYFIPIIPLGRVGEYVECGQCKGTYIPRVLENAPSNNEAFMAEYEKAIKHSMILMMLADGVIDEKEKEQVLEIINEFSQNNISSPQLEDYIVQVQKENKDVTTYLKNVGPSLNEHGKETVIKCALAVAAADGHIDDSELKMISEMGKAMEMSASHLKGILSDIFEKK